ncbi:ABC transporter permease [Parachryseolinea silvisoli]|uniref:ABC transporter permease n=1 Tax=Parachryseolinea silvisoli TaxID=2873601 RepID=UPI0022658A3F|nr:ABC transporter permease [Parachryseolinea silvisoli]MCD9019655.1 ABC transporter permease [Parachryseolinea silvisoli]
MAKDLLGNNLRAAGLLKNHFRLAGRHLMKNKGFSLINILGLAVAITSFFFIVVYASFEMSYDDLHANKDRIYRIALNGQEVGSDAGSSVKSYPGIYNFLQELSDVETATRFVKIPANTGFLFGHDSKMFNESGGHINADSNFFKVFPTLLVKGNAATALKNANSIVISESVARKVFGNTDVLGQRLDRVEENGDAPLIVTGVMRDIPKNAHFHARFVSKLEDVWPEVLEDDWLSSLIFNYALLKEHTDPGAVKSRLNQMLAQKSKGIPKIKGTSVFLQPLKDIHLQSNIKDEYEANGSATLVYLLIAIGVVIIIMGWINYINVETARFLRRAKEVGVRRIIGSSKVDLGLQFLVEFGCANLLALAIAGMLAMTLAPYFENVSGIPVELAYRNTPELWLIAFLFFAAGSIITGIYPGLYLLKLNAAHALKGTFSPQKSRGFIRKPLLVVQFSVSIILIAFLLVINGQLKYMQLTNKGVDVGSVVAVRNPVAYSNQEVIEKYNNYKLLRDKLLQRASVEMVSTSSAIPGTEIGFTYVDLIKRSLNDPYDPTRYKTMFIGENFIPLYKIKLLAGRNFEAEEINEWREPWERKDWLKIILNESAMKALGFKSPEDAVNKTVKFQAFDDFEDHEIIGVMEDYHHEAVKNVIYPMILKLNYNSYQQVYYSIRFNPGSRPQQTLSEIEQAWKEVFPGQPFEYFFMDEYYDLQFKSERQFSQVFSAFSGIAVFIACLGILGMALFETNARLKEISIRKVLGASVAHLLALLLNDQARCIIISCLVAIPVVWYGADRWLSSYPAHTQLSPWIFAIPLLVVVSAVAVLSGMQIMNVVTRNPVDHLKSE